LRVSLSEQASGDACGALLRVRSNGRTLARGLSDWRGEAPAPVVGSRSRPGRRTRTPSSRPRSTRSSKSFSIRPPAASHARGAARRRPRAEHSAGAGSASYRNKSRGCPGASGDPPRHRAIAGPVHDFRPA
jgi:hypothetical protein